MAIAGATGVSKGSALTVSNMLMPEIAAFSLTALEDLHIREDVFEGARCYCIRGQNSHGNPHDVRIGIDDHLLRSVSSTRPNGVVSHAIRRQIHVDSPIDEHAFQFHPEA
jgi:hypothetical protein